jgi:hypothetical protein
VPRAWRGSREKERQKEYAQWRRFKTRGTAKEQNSRMEQVKRDRQAEQSKQLEQLSIFQKGKKMEQRELR